ncbi:hypothetical protein Pelo_17890 [Pelomyxa schiedti]|nr:hypothetical protein Pelo_17890 [Pelomyxa schiedti]
MDHTEPLCPEKVIEKQHLNNTIQNSRLLLKVDPDTQQAKIDQLEATVQSQRKEIRQLKREKAEIADKLKKAEGARDDALARYHKSKGVINSLRSMLSLPSEEQVKRKPQGQRSPPKTTLEPPLPPPPPDDIDDYADNNDPEPQPPPDGDTSGVVISPTIIGIAHEITTPAPRHFFYASGGERSTSPPLSRAQSPPLPSTPHTCPAGPTPVMPPGTQKPATQLKSPALGPTPPASVPATLSKTFEQTLLAPFTTTAANANATTTPPRSFSPSPSSPTLSAQAQQNQNRNVSLSPVLTPASGLQRSASPAQLAQLSPYSPTGSGNRYDNFNTKHIRKSRD